MSRATERIEADIDRLEDKLEREQKLLKASITRLDFASTPLHRAGVEVLKNQITERKAWLAELKNEVL